MKKVILAIAFSILFTDLFSQNESKPILALLQDQVSAFNEGDIDRLVDNVSEDFKWYYIGADTLILEVSGKNQFRKSMEGYFSQIKDVQSEIAEYAIDGNRISFKEVVSYETTSGSKSSTSALAIYEVKNHLIYRVWYFF